MASKFKISSILAALVVPALIMSLTACNMGGKSTEKGQTITLTEGSEPPSLDSAKSTDNASFKILNNTMEGLMRAGKDGNPVLGIAAEMPEVSADKTTYKFKLRDAKWSDGKPVTAKDFEYSWLRALNPKTASEYAYILHPIKGAEEYNTGKGSLANVGIKAIDDKTFEIKLKAPTPYFLDLLGFPTYLPQRQDIVEKFGDKYALEASNLVFNGPFVLSEWKHNSSYQMKKNDNYWDKAAVRLEQIDTQIVKDLSTAINLYETGKVDFTVVSEEYVDKYKTNKDRFVIKEAVASYVELNEKLPLFKNSKVRQAFALAVDRSALTDRVLKNGSTPASGIVPPEIRVNQTEKFDQLLNTKPQFDPAKAKALLAEGLKESGLKLPAKLVLLGDDTSTAKKILEFLQEQYRTNLGVSIEINSVPFKQRLARSKSGQFDMVATNWGADYNDPMTFLDLFITGNSFNHGKWSNLEYDRLIKKSKGNANFEERTQDLLKASKILTEEAAISPLFSRARIGLKREKIKDWFWHVVGPESSLKWAYVEEK